MSDTGKQSPLGNNVNGSYLQNTGFRINPVAQAYMGISHVNEKYIFGSIVNDTCLKYLTWAIFDAYNRGVVTASVYNSLISIGAGVSEALGNSKPPTYKIVDPRETTPPSNSWSQVWRGVATTGYALPNPTPPETRSTNTGRGQSATWLPYQKTDGSVTQPNDSITQWGFIRCWALQAWNEFNWNGDPTSEDGPVQYKDFVSSFLQVDNFIKYQNNAVNSLQNSKDFLKGTYSNMDDLISADITGVSLATQIFGQDCITAGKVIDLSKLDKFGLPSVLLQTIKKYNGLTTSLAVALISAGLSLQEVETIVAGSSTAGKTQEQQIYAAFLVIKGEDLQNILVTMNCKTKGLETLADLLNVKKLFPNSYQTLTVPVYNTKPSPNNSKTYYPIFEGTGVSSRIQSSTVKAQIGSKVIPGDPPIVNKPSPSKDASQAIIEAAVNTSPAQRIVSLGNSTTGIGGV